MSLVGTVYFLQSTQILFIKIGLRVEYRKKLVSINDQLMPFKMIVEEGVKLTYAWFNLNEKKVSKSSWHFRPLCWIECTWHGLDLTWLNSVP